MSEADLPDIKALRERLAEMLILNADVARAAAPFMLDEAISPLMQLEDLANRARNSIAAHEEVIEAAREAYGIFKAHYERTDQMRASFRRGS